MDSTNSMGENCTNFLRNNMIIEKLNLAGLYVTEHSLKNIVTCENLKELIFSYDYDFYLDSDDEEFTLEQIASILTSGNLNRDIKLEILIPIKKYQIDVESYRFDIAMLQLHFPNFKIKECNHGFC